MIHDMTTYFDAVLDENMTPLCNGTPEEVLEWLDQRKGIEDEVCVCVGRTMKIITVKEYLEQFG